MIKSGQAVELILTPVSTIYHDLLCVNFISCGFYNCFSFDSLKLDNIILMAEMVSLKDHASSNRCDLS